MKENAAREELADKYAKCSRRARAANANLRSSSGQQRAGSCRWVAKQSNFSQ